MKVGVAKVCVLQVSSAESRLSAIDTDECCPPEVSTAQIKPVDCGCPAPRFLVHLVCECSLMMRVLMEV